MTVIDVKSTGRNIKNIMHSKNIKVSDIAEMLGFGTSQAVYKWLRGVNMPTLDNLVMLSEIFDMSIDEIVVKTKID